MGLHSKANDSSAATNDEKPRRRKWGVNGARPIKRETVVMVEF
jgi:hypothetical protein